MSNQRSKEGGGRELRPQRGSRSCQLGKLRSGGEFVVCRSKHRMRCGRLALIRRDYEVLGLHPGASLSEVKVRKRRLKRSSELTETKRRNKKDADD